MSIYDVNFRNVASQLLPPDKRRLLMLAFVRALLSPLQYLRDLNIGSYKDGSPAVVYAAGTYSRGNRVRYFQAVYESLVDNNTAVPVDATAWVKVQENFIGVRERVQYNGQKVVLEYALNKWFNTQFRQPDGVSDIYITSSERVTPVFRIGATEKISSAVSTAGSTEFVENDYSLTAQISFAVHVPVAVYNALDPIAGNRDAVVRAFVDKYIHAGVLYSIVTY